MRRRDFLRTGAAIGLSTAFAGCNTSSTDQSEPTDSPSKTGSPTETGTEPGTDEEEQQTTEDPETAVRYFFEDETGALGHLADDEIPESYDNVVTNTTSEQEYDEIQRNDRSFAEDAASNQMAPQGEGLDMTVDEMIQRAEEVYQNPTQEIDTHDVINIEQEDDEITFVRSLIQASIDAGVDSSGLANIVVANIAEDAVDQIQPGFTDFKLSTLPATEPIQPSNGGRGAGERTNDYNITYINSGFVHMPGILQYEKDGETKVKYAEQTDPVSISLFRHVIRDPEDSMYRESLEQDSVGDYFPEHYVTAFDYEKARQLESEDILGFDENDDGGINALGDYLVQTMMNTVDDMGITGYDNNPDRENIGVPTDGKLVSDEFGQSVEEYATNPTTEKREHFRNVSRGIYRLFQQEGWETSIALTGTLENPEILPTDQDTVNQVRQDQAYDQVRERVAG